jgi:hypothetical protein
MTKICPVWSAMKGTKEGCNEQCIFRDVDWPRVYCSHGGGKKLIMILR